MGGPEIFTERFSAGICYSNSPDVYLYNYQNKMNTFKGPNLPEECEMAQSHVSLYDVLGSIYS